MNKKKVLVSMLIIIVLIGVAIIFMIDKNESGGASSDEPEKIEYIKAYELGRGLYPKEFYPSIEDLEYTLYITDFEDYKKMASYYDNPLELTKKDFEKNDFLVVHGNYDSCSGNILGIIKTEYSTDTLHVTFGVELGCGGCAPDAYFYLIPVEKGENARYKIKAEYYGINDPECDPGVVYKPIIYLYPEEEMEVTVKLGYPKKLLTSYPKYENEWNVLAKPNGDLIDLETKRSLYALYWEGENTSSKGIRDEGFVVSKEEIIPFLEEKLSLLGLNDREANEFIIYWLPLLEESEYNYIYFETLEEINTNMPLNINPSPDTLIRVVMEFKGLDKPIEVKEQQFKAPTRNGFTVVEWGGTRLN